MGIPTQMGLVVVLAAIFASLLAPLSRRLGFASGAVDRPGGRRQHTGSVPRLGGTAVGGALALALATSTTMGWVPPDTFVAWDVLWPLVGLGALLVVSIGAADDLRALGPGPKILVEIVAASMVVASGAVIAEVTNPLTGYSHPLGIWAGLITMLWVLAVTNAFNLIDGLDGLAAGVGLIVATTLALLSLSAGRPDVAILAATLAGALGGFLFFNFNPATIFLGDSGSLLLGYLLSVLAIESAHKSTTAVFILTPILALGVPLMETVLTVVRRFLGSLRRGARQGLRHALVAGSASVLRPDRDHIHHRLLAIGLSHRSAVLVLYATCVLLNLGAVLTIRGAASDTALISFMIAAAMFFGVRKLGYRSRLRPTREVGRPHALLAFADAFALALAYAAAVLLCEGLPAPTELTALVGPAVAVSAAEMTLLLVCGLYRHDAAPARRADAALLGTLLLAIGIVAVVLRAAAGVGPSSLEVAALHFVLAALLLAGIRQVTAVRRRLMRGGREGTGQVALPVGSVRTRLSEVGGRSRAA